MKGIDIRRDAKTPKKARSSLGARGFSSTARSVSAGLAIKSCLIGSAPPASATRNGGDEAGQTSRRTGKPEDENVVPAVVVFDKPLIDIEDESFVLRRFFSYPRTSVLSPPPNCDVRKKIKPAICGAAGFGRWRTTV